MSDFGLILISCCFVIVLLFSFGLILWGGIIGYITNIMRLNSLSNNGPNNGPTNGPTNGPINGPNTSDIPKWKKIVELLRVNPRWKVNVLGTHQGDITFNNITYEVVPDLAKNFAVGEYGKISFFKTMPPSDTTATQTTAESGTWHKIPTISDGIRIETSSGPVTGVLQSMDLQYLSNSSINMVIIDETRPGSEVLQLGTLTVP